MFTQVSWGNYFTAIAFISAGYYLVIGYIYYRHDFLQLLSGKKITPGNSVVPVKNYQPLAQSFSDEVQAFMQQAAREQLAKENIVVSVQSLLNKYPALKDLAFRESIRNLVISECKSYCSIHLSEEELGVLWN